MGFWGDLGVGAKTVGGKVHPSLELRVFRHLWSRSDAPCSCILCVFAICHRQKFGGPQLPYQKSQEISSAGRQPFGLHTKKSEFFCDVTPGL